VHLNTTGATAWKRVLHRVGHKLIEDQTQEHGLVHVQREAVGFAPDHDGPAMCHLFEIVTQLANICRAVQRHVLITRSKAPMHARHDFDLLDRLVQAPSGLDVVDRDRLHAEQSRNGREIVRHTMRCFPE
jgi:hypothetical protein